MTNSPPSRTTFLTSFKRVVFGVLIFFVIFIFILDFFSTAWPPGWVELRTQRQKVLKRVQVAGGWEAVRAGCETLVTNYPNGLSWFPPASNVWVYSSSKSIRPYVTNLNYGTLPTAVAALQPKQIGISRNFSNEQRVAVVRIKILVMHATGGHSTPYYGLEVPCGPGSETYEPRSGESGGVSGNGHSNFKKITDRIFEIY